MLPPGALAYRLRATFVADYDEVITEDPEETDMDALLEQCLAMDAETLERDVYEEVTIILCKTCKDATVSRLLRDKDKNPGPDVPIEP